jgi:hypothetical protein
MWTTSRLLAAAKKGVGLPSNYALTRALGITDKTMSRWSTGKGFPDELLCIRLAAMADADPAEVLAGIAAERAASSSDDEVRKVWETIAKRSRAAAVAAMAVFL